MSNENDSAPAPDHVEPALGSYADAREIEAEPLPPAPEAAPQRIPASAPHLARLAVLEQTRDVAAVAANCAAGAYERIEDLEADVAHCERAQREASEAAAKEAAGE